MSAVLPAPRAAPNLVRRRRRRRALWSLVAAVTVTVAATLPADGAAVLATVELGGAAAVALALRRHRLLRSRPGLSLLVLLVFLGLSSLALVLRGPGDPAALVLILLGQVVGISGTVPSYLAHSRPPAAVRRVRTMGAEVAVVAVGTALAVAQSWAYVQRTGGDVTASVTAGIDLVGIALVSWVLLTRRRALPTVRLAMGAGAVLMTQNFLAAAGGVELGSAAEWGQPLGVAGAVMLAAGASHPSLATLAAGRYRPLLRTGAERLLVVLPFALVPALSWVVGLLVPGSALPAPVLLAAALGISVLSLLTAFGLVGETERDAETDTLTGHPGRLGAMRRLDDLHGRARPTWVVLVDVDDFTDVNQRHGQDAGDAALCAVLGRLARELPEGAFVSRLAGDELLVLLPRGDRDGEDGQGCAAPGEVVRAVFTRPFPAGEAMVRLTVSVGVADLLLAADGGARASGRSAVDDADLAQRLAKSTGGDRAVLHSEEVRAQVMEPVHLLRDLRRMFAAAPPPLAEGDPGPGHLVVLYQPIVDVRTGLPDYVEALVRWQHPRRGVVAPDTFLPLAEAAGVAALLDRAVMTQALSQLAAWDADEVGVRRVSVNLGSASMREGGLCEVVLRACRQAGVGVDRLVMEITEHDELDVGGAVVEDLLALRDAGAGVALDDFGAGHASVGYLRRWPAGVVKLDRSLLPGVVVTAAHEAMLDARHLLRAVSSLVHALDRELLVEGVEDEADLALVVSLGAGHAQGYYFSRPLPPEELAAWWAQRTAGAGAAPGEAVPAGLGAAGERVGAGEDRLP